MLFSVALDDSATLLEETFSTLDEDSSSSSAESEVVHAVKKIATKPARKNLKNDLFIPSI
jgi:hypothetical protein